MEDLLTHVVVAAVVRQLNPVARTRQINAQDLSDGRRRAVGHHQHAIGEHSDRRTERRRAHQAAEGSAASGIAGLLLFLLRCCLPAVFN